MITLATLDEYIELLEVLDGWSHEEDCEIALKAYMDQWGMTPRQHRDLIEHVWAKAEETKKWIIQ